MSRRGAGVAQRGFSLLEAIVALTVFSVCTVALYGWLATNVNALERVHARSSALRDSRAALAVLESVNPMLEPKGRRILPGDLEVRWASRVVQARRTGKAPSGQPLIFDVALYDLDVEVRRGGRELNRFTVRRAGWESVRRLSDEF